MKGTMSLASIDDSQVHGLPLCGVDIEHAATFPETEDYLQHQFYRDHFTRDEIDYCSAQFEPRLHFAARWCAKEAVRKCLSALMNVDNSKLEVRKRPDGAPFLVMQTSTGTRGLPVSLSLSHSGGMAIAMVTAHPSSLNSTLV
jgi:phosphopantetheine--protein transferase-like protein